MAKVVVLPSAAGQPFDPWKHGTAFLIRHSAEQDTFGIHQLTDDPREADLILFGEMAACGKFAEMVRSHPYYRRFPEKCFIFDSADFFYPIVPGLYPSLTEDQYRPDHTRTGFYLYLVTNAFITPRPLSGREVYLASFVGSANTHPMRRQLFEFNREDIFVRDTSQNSQRMQYEGGPAERAQFWSEYADWLADARFSLCPRGMGAGSIRLYESMKMGRAPVIISDRWHPNEGIDWNSFSFRVPESDVHRIPELLEQNAHRAPEMGARARAEWENWFSEKVCFHRIVESCLDIARHRGKSTKSQRLYDLRHILQHPRWYLNSKKWLYQQNGKRIYW